MSHIIQNTDCTFRFVTPFLFSIPQRAPRLPLFLLMRAPSITIELFTSIFHSFAAGIADAISSFKLRKIFMYMEIRHLQY